MLRVLAFCSSATERGEPENEWMDGFDLMAAMAPGDGDGKRKIVEFKHASQDGETGDAGEEQQCRSGGGEHKRGGAHLAGGCAARMIDDDTA